MINILDACLLGIEGFVRDIMEIGKLTWRTLSKKSKLCFDVCGGIHAVLDIRLLCFHKYVSICR